MGNLSDRQALTLPRFTCNSELCIYDVLLNNRFDRHSFPLIHSMKHTFTRSSRKKRRSCRTTTSCNSYRSRCESQSREKVPNRRSQPPPQTSFQLQQPPFQQQNFFQPFQQPAVQPQQPYYVSFGAKIQIFGGKFKFSNRRTMAERVALVPEQALSASAATWRCVV